MFEQADMERWAQELAAERRIFAPFTELIRRGEPSDRIIVLVRGTVEVILRKERILLTGPTWLGEIGFLGDLPAGADVRTVDEVLVYIVKREEIRRWGRERPESFSAFYTSLSQVAIRRLSGEFHSGYCAVIAHDARKKELLQLIGNNEEFFRRCSLIATASTGLRIEQELNLPVARRALSGPHGGDQEIGALVSRGLVEAVFFYRDPLWAPPHHADVNALIRICELTNVPLATNEATAQLLINGLMQKVSEPG
ncbi:MAG TPA: methylglyoxal synthase [Desulfurivibrio alkaliphilus]|uniref:Methylglyoxal synthase n=1 Tax=Desulfurivibrio alkaliphilus TaxID=427923 RepID=A0A7C2XMZ1_9BACT|nr:methylglyoxal synthase [Desulfurivibrio alkaliphilus]